MTLTKWWRINKVLPPFTVTFKRCGETEITITGVKVYEHGIWFLDSFDNEYFNGDLVEVARVPYIVGESERRFL